MASARNWPMPAPAGFRHCAQDVVNSPCFSTSSLDTATSPPSHLPSFSHLPPAAACADTAIVARVLHPQPHAQARANARAAAVLEEQRRREEEQLAALVAAEAARSPPQQVLQRIKESLHAPHPSVDSLCRSAADLGHLLFSAAAVNTRAGGSTLVAPIVARGHASRPQRHAPHAMGRDGPAVDGTISGERPGLSVLASSFSSVDVSGFQESGPSRGGWEEEEPVADSRFCPATAIYGGSIVGQCAVLLTEILTFTSHPGVRAAAFSQLWRNRELLCYLNLPSQSIAAEGFRRNLLAVLNQQNLDNRTRAMGMILISNGGASIIGQDAAILEATLQSLASLWGEALSLVEQEQFAKTASSAPSTSSCPVSSFLPPPVSSDSLTGASSVTNWATDVPGAGIDRRRLDPPAATFCPDSVFLEKTGRLDVTSQPISSCCSDEEQTPDLVAAASAAGMAEVAFDAIAALLPFLSGDSGIRVLQRICSYTWLPVLQAGEGSEERTQGEGNQDAGVERRLGKYSVERIPESPLVRNGDEDWNASGIADRGDCEQCRWQARSMRKFPFCMQRASSVATLLACTSSLQADVAAWALRMLWDIIDSLNDWCSSFGATALTAVEAQRRLMALQPLQLFRDPSNQDSASSSLTEGRNFANDDDDESVTRRHLSGGSDGLLQLESGVSRGTVPSPHGSLQRGRCGGCGAASVYYLRMKQSLATMATCVEATHKLALNHADSLGPLQVAALKQVLSSCGCSRMWHTGVTAPGAEDVEEEGAVVAAALRCLLDFLLLGLVRRSPPFTPFLACPSGGAVCLPTISPHFEAGQRRGEKPAVFLLGGSVETGLLSAASSFISPHSCPTFGGVSSSAPETVSSNTMKGKTASERKCPVASFFTSARPLVGAGLTGSAKHGPGCIRKAQSADLSFRRDTVQLREILFIWLRAAALEGAAAVSALLAVLSVVTGWSLPDSEQSERLSHTKKKHGSKAGGGSFAAGSTVPESGSRTVCTARFLTQDSYGQQAVGGCRSASPSRPHCLLHESGEEVIIHEGELESPRGQEVVRAGFSRAHSGTLPRKHEFSFGVSRIPEPEVTGAGRSEAERHDHEHGGRKTKKERQLRHEGSGGGARNGNSKKVAIALSSGRPSVKIASSLAPTPRTFSPASPVPGSAQEDKVSVPPSPASPVKEGTSASALSRTLAHFPSATSLSFHHPSSTGGLALPAAAQQTILPTQIVSGTFLLSGLRQLAALRQEGLSSTALSFPGQSCSTVPLGSSLRVPATTAPPRPGRTEGSDQGKLPSDAKGLDRSTASTTKVDTSPDSSGGAAVKQSRKSPGLSSPSSSSEEEGEEKEEGELSDDGATSSSPMAKSTSVQEYAPCLSACANSPQVLSAAATARAPNTNDSTEQKRETVTCVHPPSALARETCKALSKAERASSPLVSGRTSPSSVAVEFSSPNSEEEANTDSSSMEDSTEGIVQFEVLSLRSFRRRCRACGTRPLDARRGHFDGDARRRVGADGRMSKRRGGKKEDRCYGDGPRDVLSSPIAAWAVATPSKTFPFSIKSALPGGPTHTNHQPCPACEEAAADYHFRRREELKTTLHLLLQLSKKESKSPHRLRVLSLLVALQTVSWLSFPLPRAVAVSVASKKNLKEEAGSCRPSPAAEQSLPEDKPGQVVQQGFAQFTKKEGKVAGKEEQIAELKPGSGNRVFWTCCEGAAPTVHAALREDNRVVKQLVTAVAEALADYLVDEEDPPPAMLNRHTLHGFFFGTWKEVWNSASGLEQERTQHIVAAWLGRCFLSIQFHSPCTSQVMAEAFLSRLLTCSQASFLQSRCRGPLVSTACVLALPALSLLPLSSLSRLLSPFFASTPPGAGDSSSPAPASPFFLNGRPHPASPTFRSANEETRFTSAQKARVPPALFGTLGSSVGLKFIFQQGLQGPAAGVPLDCLLKPFRREEERQQTPRWAPGEATPQSGAAGPIVPPIQAASDGYLREASPFSREAGYVLDSCGAHFDWLRVYREGIEVFLCQLSAAYRLPGSRHVGTDSPSVILPHLTFSLVLPVSFLHCRTGLYPPVLSSGTSSSTGVPQSQGPASRTDLPSFVSTSCTAPPEERELSVQRLPLFQFDFPLSYRTLYKAAVFAGVAGFSQFASASFEACARVTVTTESCSWLRALGAALRAEAALSVRGSILAKSSFQCPSEAGSGHATAGPPVPAMAASERLGSRLAFHRDGRAKVETISDSLAEAVQRARLAMSGAEGFWRAALDQLEVFRRQQQRVLGAGQSSSGGKPQPLLEAFARGRLATMSALLSVIAFCSKCCHVPRLPGHRQKSSSTPKYPKEVRKVEQTQLLSSSPAVEPGRQSGLTVVFRHPPPEVISPSSAASPLPPPHVPVASSRCLCGSETCETCACGAKAPEVSLLGSSGRSRVFCLEDAIEVRHEGAVFEEILASLEQLRSQFRGLHVQFSHFATQPLPLCPTSRRLLGLQDCLCRTGVLLTSFLMTRLLRSHALILCFSRGFRYIRRQPLCKCISAARPNEKGEQLPQSQQSEKAPAYIERNTTSRSQYGRARGSNPPKVSTHAKKNATDSPEWHPANNTVVDTSENMEGISESSPSLPEPAQLGSGTDAKYLFSPVLGLVSLSSDGLFGLSGAVEQLNVALEALASARHTRSEFLPFSPSCCSFAHRPESLNLLPLWLEASASSPGHALCWRPANSEILDTTSTREMSPHVVWSRKASVCPEGCSSGPARCATSTQRDDEREGALQLPVSDGALLSVCAACDRVGQQKVCTQGCGGGVSPRLTSKLDIGRVSAPANNETRLVKTEENTESDAPREARTSDYCALPLLHAQKVRPFYFLENLIPRLVLVAPPLLVCKHSGSPAVCASRAGSHVSAAPRAETRSPAVVPQNRVPSPGLLEGTSSDSEGAGYAPPPPTHEGSRASTGAVTSVSAASDATSQENSGTERRDVVGDRGKGITGARNQTAAVVCNDPGVIDVDNEGQTVTVGQESSNKGSPAQFDCDALRGDTRRGTGENREDTQEGRSHSGAIKKDDATPRVASKATFFETDQIDACSLWGNLEEEEDTTASSLLLRTAFPPVLLRQVVELVEHCMYTPFPLPPRIFNPRPLPWVAVRAVLSGEEEDSRGRCVLPTIFFTGELRDAGVQTVAAWDFVRLRLSVGSGQGSFQQATLHSSLQVRDKGQDVISVDDVPVTQPVPQTRSLPRSKDSFRRGGAVQKNASPLRHAGGLRTFAHTTVLNVSMAVLPCLLVEALPLDSRRRVIGERSSTFVAVRTAQKDLDL